MILDPDACKHDAYISIILDPDACVYNEHMYDPWIYDHQYLTLMHVCVMHVTNGGERTNEQTDSWILGVGFDTNLALFLSLDFGMILHLLWVTSYISDLDQIDKMTQNVRDQLGWLAIMLILVLYLQDQLGCLLVSRLWNEYIGGPVFHRKIEVSRHHHHHHQQSISLMGDHWPAPPPSSSSSFLLSS